MRRWVAIVCALLVAAAWSGAGFVVASARADGGGGGGGESAGEPTFRIRYIEPTQTPDGPAIDENALLDYVAEVLKAAGQEAGFHTEFADPVPANEALPALLKGDTRLIAPMRVVEMNLGKAGFTTPVLLAKGAVFYQSGRTVEDVKELRKKMVGVVTASASHRWAVERQIPVREFGTVQAAMAALAGGKVDAVLTSEIAGGIEIEKRGLSGIEHSVLDNGNALSVYVVATRLDDEAALAKLNQGFELIQNNGKARSIYIKHFGKYQRWWGDQEVSLLMVIAIGAPILAAGVIAFLVVRYRLVRRSRDLAESEEQYRLMAENLSGISYRYVLLPGGERRMLSTNSLFPVWQEKFPALTKEMAIEDALLTGVHAEDAERLKKAMSQSRESMRPMEVEFRLLDKAGVYQWIHARSFASKHPDGIVWQGILLNVTHQRQLAASLHESEVKFQEIVEHCHDGILAVSRPAGTVVEANVAAAAALGCGRDVLIGSSLATTLPEMKDRLAAGFGAAVEAKVQHRGGDGKMRDLEVRIKPMEFGGKEAAIILLRDVTERERIARERARLEMEMARTQKLEGLGVMAGGIAHDFNNILVGILGSLSLAELQVDEGSPAAETIKLVQRSAGRAADLTSKLLAYSGGAAIEKKSVDLRNMLTSSRELLEMAAGRRAAFSIRVPEHSVTIMGDAVQLGQVAMNLVSNAAEAITHQNGKVEVTLDIARLDGSRPRGLVGSDVPAAGEYARLSVKDNGSGISDETMQRIFEPFVTTKFAGRGLGLAASIGIVRAHRGAMCLTTATGEGTEFQVLLPLAETQPTTTVEVKPVKREISAANNRTVLVVDDEQIVRETLGAMLRSLKANVIEADGGDRALDILRDGADADCVLLDLTMPGKDGLKTLAEIRKMRPKLPVILCSGFTEMPELAANSMVSFLAKPYTVDELAAQIKRAVATV